jgi:hypothetical protein
MQQNAIGSQYDQDNAKAAAEEAQVKVQMDKAKVEEEQVRTQRERLANIVTESGIHNTKEMQDAIKKFQADPSTKELSGYEAAKRMADLVAPYDPAGATQIMQRAAIADLHEAQAAMKKSDEAHDTIAGAYANISAAPDEKFQDMIGKFSDKQKAAIKAQIPDFFEEKDNKLQKEQLKQLMLTAAGRNFAMQEAMREQLHEHQLTIRKEIEKMREHAAEVRKGAGSSTREEKLEEKSAKEITNKRLRIDQEYDKQVREAKDNYDKLRKEARASGWAVIGMEPTAAIGKANEAYKTWMGLQKERDQKKLDALDIMPTSEAKNKEYERNLLLMSTYDQPMGDIMGEDKKPNTPPKKEAGKSSSGTVTEPAPSASAPAAGKKEVAPKGKAPSNKSAGLDPKYVTSAIEKANKAIKDGADPKAVKKRLEEAGIKVE